MQAEIVFLVSVAKCARASRSVGVTSEMISEGDTLDVDQGPKLMAYEPHIDRYFRSKSRELLNLAKDG